MSTLKTLGALGLLTAAAPLNAALTAAALATTPLTRRTPARPERRLTVMVGGGKMTKALALARAFHRAGHRVVLVEGDKYALTGHRFSRAVDVFHATPMPGKPGYAEALAEIARAEGVDVYVPVCSPVASYQDALAKAALSRYCTVLHLEPEQVAMLDDKAAFTQTAADLGLTVPDTVRVTSADEAVGFLRGAEHPPYVAKSIAYDPVHRLDLTPLPRPTEAETRAFLEALPITPDNPWILSQYVEGTEVCTHSTVRDGVVRVWCCCPSSAFQVNYEQVELPAVREWVEAFVGKLGLTGQVSFDFLVDAAGTPYAIECNPRTHSAITMLYDHPGLADAYLSPGSDVVEPTAASRPTYWAYHEAWRALSQPSSARERLGVVLRGKDAIFDWSDPLPFLVQHHVQVPRLLLRALRGRSDWIRIDFNIGKLVEPAGD